MFLTFKKWVKNVQTAGYNGARTVNIWLFHSFYLGIIMYIPQLDWTRNSHSLEQ